MALIKCPECGKEISDKSDKCIHCGFPLRNTPFLQENINGKYYDINFLTDKNISQAKKITMLRELTNYEMDLMDAKKLVLKYHPTQQQESSKKVEEDNNTPHCPYCNSTNIKKITTGSKVAHTALFGIFSMSRNSKQWHCNNCKSDF